MTLLFLFPFREFYLFELEVLLLNLSLVMDHIRLYRPIRVIGLWIVHLILWLGLFQS